MRTNTLATSATLEKKKPITRNAPKPSPREPDSVTTDLDRHARDLGFSVKELRGICLRAGLDQLNQGGVKVFPKRRDDSRSAEPIEILEVHQKKLFREAGRRGISVWSLTMIIMQHGLDSIANGKLTVEPVLPGKRKSAPHQMPTVPIYTDTKARVEAAAKKQGFTVCMLVSYSMKHVMDEMESGRLNWVANQPEAEEVDS